jgi:hypothetical protein
MRFSRFTEEEDFRDAPCTLCGRGTFKLNSAVFVDLSEDEPDGFLAEAFCTWEHFEEWVAKGRPESDRWERLDDDDVMMLEDWWFRVRYGGVGQMLSNIRAGLATYGLYVLTQRWAAKHPDEVARLGRRFPRLTSLLGAPEELHR